MTLALIVLLVTAGLELVFLATSNTPQRWSAWTLSVLAAASAIFLVYERSNVFTALVAVLMVYRIVNLKRLTSRQLEIDYVGHLARRASLWLITCQAVLLCMLLLQTKLGVTADDWFIGLAVFGLFAAGLLAHTTQHQARTTKSPIIVAARTEQDLPSLTVAIPARNETVDLEDCLRTLINSSYLKLEILVLDDCSQNQRTPEIIRALAHDGVRFIAGTVPPDNWLAKNHAYNQLLQEANGELVLFCGVDARFEVDSLRSLVETLLDKHKTMLSVMPSNQIPGRFQLEAMMVQPGRYAWELALPRRWLDRPPVLSTCWLARRGTLTDAGGFAAVSRTVSPERYFARFAATHNDGYSFLQSGEQLGVSSLKSFTEQRATAIRTRYPQLHRRIELTAIVSLLEVLVLVVPYVNLVDCLVRRQWAIAVLFMGSCALLTYVYARIVGITYQRSLVRGLWLLPFAVIYDIALLNYSMWQYEFREVIWKGRNVCVPVMRVIPRLPNLQPQAAGQQQPYPHHRHHKHHRRHKHLR